jgi:hypothetical protein
MVIQFDISRDKLKISMALILDLMQLGQLKIAKKGLVNF